MGWWTGKLIKASDKMNALQYLFFSGGSLRFEFLDDDEIPFKTSPATASDFL